MGEVAVFKFTGFCPLLYCNTLYMLCLNTSSCLSLPDYKSKFELERKDTDCYNSSNTSVSQQQHQSPLLPLPLPTPQHPFSPKPSAGVPGAGGVSVVTAAHLPDSTTDSWSGYYSAQRQDGVGKPFCNKNVSLKQRCRDYDGRNILIFSPCLFISSFYQKIRAY